MYGEDEDTPSPRSDGLDAENDRLEQLALMSTVEQLLSSDIRPIYQRGRLVHCTEVHEGVRHLHQDSNAGEDDNLRGFNSIVDGDTSSVSEGGVRSDRGARKGGQPAGLLGLVVDGVEFQYRLLDVRSGFAPGPQEGAATGGGSVRPGFEPVVARTVRVERVKAVGWLNRGTHE